MNAPDTAPRRATGRIRSVSSFVIGIFTRNLISKIAALVLAVLVWITVRQDLTRTEMLEARVLTEYPANIMLLADAPETVTVELTGPTSEIDQLRRNPEDVEIVLRVSDKDLGDDLTDTRIFSVERGNIEHNFGEHVRITKLPVETIRLRVAVRSEERKPVARPTLLGLPAEWEARLELLSPEVRLTGPKEILDRITEVETTPIAANRLLDGVEGDEYSTTVELALTDAILADRITRKAGERISCRITLTRSQAQQEFIVPFTVFLEDANWPVVTEIHETQLVKRADHGGFTIRLFLKGSPTDLTRVQEATAAGRVRAYVRALELSSYAQQAAGRENANVHVELPAELWDRVSLIPPPREDIDISILVRKKTPEDNE